MSLNGSVGYGNLCSSALKILLSLHQLNFLKEGTGNFVSMNTNY